MNKYFVFILAFAAATQGALADPQEKHQSQDRAPQQSLQREQRQMPVQREMPVQRAMPVRQAPVMHERAIPAVPVREPRQGPMPERQMPIDRERAIPAIPVRERTRPMPDSAASAVWRDQHERNMPVRNMPVREMPRVFRNDNNSAAAAVWRDQHERGDFVVRHVEFERFHPRHVFIADPVIVAPQIVAPTIVTTQFIQPVIAAPVFVPGVIENGIAPVSYAYTGYVPMYAPAMIGYAPTFSSVPLYDTSYVSFLNPAPFTTYAAYSDDCDDEDDNCYSPYVAYAQPAYTYVGPAINPYGNAQLQGVVIGQTGNSLIVLAPNLQPVFVNTGVAAQAGYLQGSIAPGSVINALGYYVGNQFIATALV